jgi:hypothetical protein
MLQKISQVCFGRHLCISNAFCLRHYCQVTSSKAYVVSKSNYMYNLSMTSREQLLSLRIVRIVSYFPVRNYKGTSLIVLVSATSAIPSLCVSKLNFQLAFLATWSEISTFCAANPISWYIHPFASNIGNAEIESGQNRASSE